MFTANQTSKFVDMTKEELTQLVTIADLENFYQKLREDMQQLMNQNQKEFYTPKEFSKKTGMPYTTVIHYCKTRQLKARQEFSGGSWQIFASEIDRFKKEANINYSEEF